MYSQNQFNEPYQQPAFNRASGLITGALITGILALILLFTFTVFPAMLLGGTSIVLALLSRGKQPQIPGHAKIGMTCAIIALIANIGIVFYSGYMLLYNSEVRSEVNRLYEAIYGDSFDDAFEELFGYELPNQ